MTSFIAMENSTSKQAGTHFNASTLDFRNGTIEDELGEQDTQAFPPLVFDYARRSEDFRLAVSWAMVFVTACNIVSNGLIVVQMVKFRWLRNHTNFLILSLSVVGLLHCLSVMPLVFQDFTNSPLPPVICKLISYADLIIQLLCLLHLMAINAERVFAIRYPLKYKAVMTTKVALTSIVVSWLVSIGMAVLIVSILCDGYDNLLCRVQPVSGGAAILLSILLFGLPYLICVIGYANIYRIVNRHLRFMNQNGGRSSNSDGILRVIAGVLGVMLVGYGPFMMTAPLFFYVDAETAAVLTYYVFPTEKLWVHVAMALNPLVYALASPKYKTAFAILFRRQQSTNSIGPITGS